MYYKGRGVPKDLKKAVYWLRKAADRGYAEAQYKLGELYAKGEDWKQAEFWYRKAAKQGHEKAANALDELENPRIGDPVR